MNPMERLQRSVDLVGGAETEDVEQARNQGILGTVWGSARNPGTQYWD